MSKAQAMMYCLLFISDKKPSLVASVCTGETSLVANGYSLSHPFPFDLLISNMVTPGVVIANNMGGGACQKEGRRSQTFSNTESWRYA